MERLTKVIMLIKAMRLTIDENGNRVFSDQRLKEIFEGIKPKNSRLTFDKLMERLPHTHKIKFEL